MGSFSWLKAERSQKDKVANIPAGSAFKFLIPKEFGGGFIIDNCYNDFGYLDNEKYDMYEILAFWNKDMKEVATRASENSEVVMQPYNVSEHLQFDGDCPRLKERDQYTSHNRSVGIDIGCYDYQIDALKYPLKLVSVDLDITYEQCCEPSYGDPHQGFYEVDEDGNVLTDDDFWW